MNIKTSRFGDIDVPEDSIVTFPSGLVGLPNHTRYVVFDVESDSGYQWIQSLDDETLAVVIVHAHLLHPNFSEFVPQESLSGLDVHDDDLISISLIVTIPPGRPDQATANFRAPIVVNLRTRQAKQVILHESLPLHVPLVEESQKETEEQICLQGAIKA